jgi:hypothetical protein
MGLNMLSEFLLGDEDYGGGPSGNAGCGFVFLIVGAGVLFACAATRISLFFG